MDADVFLRKLYEKLAEDNWGTIEPLWFKPEFVKIEPGEAEATEEQGWAAVLQGYVREILEEED